MEFDVYIEISLLLNVLRSALFIQNCTFFVFNNEIYVLYVMSSKCFGDENEMCKIYYSLFNEKKIIIII